MDFSCPRRFHYILEVIDELIFTNKDGSSNENWSIEFCKKKGMACLIRIYSQIPEDYLKSRLNLLCFGLVAKIMCFFIRKYSTILPSDTNKNNIELIQKSLFYLKEAISISKSPPELDFVCNVLDLIISCLLITPKFVQILYSYQHLKLILKFCILESEDSKLRSKVSEILISLTDFYIKNPIENVANPGAYILENVLFNMIKDGLEDFSEKCNHFFDFFISLIDRFKDHNFASFELDDIFEVFSNILLSENNLELFQKKENYLLQGCIKFFDCIIKIDAKYMNMLLQKKIISYFFDVCLFQMPIGILSTPKCKNNNTRKLIFSLLAFFLTNNNHHSSLEIIYKFNLLVQRSFWRNKHYSDWTLSSNENEKSELGNILKKYTN